MGCFERWSSGGYWPLSSTTQLRTSPCALTLQSGLKKGYLTASQSVFATADYELICKLWQTYRCRRMASVSEVFEFKGHRTGECSSSAKILHNAETQPPFKRRRNTQGTKEPSAASFFLIASQNCSKWKEDGHESTGKVVTCLPFFFFFFWRPPKSPG